MHESHGLARNCCSYRGDLSADADWLVARVGEEVAIHRDHLAVVLVSKACVVPVCTKM